MRMARRRPFSEMVSKIRSIEVNKSTLECGRSQSRWNWIVLFSDDRWHHHAMLPAIALIVSLGCQPPEWHHPAEIGSKAWLASSARDRYRSLFQIESMPVYRQYIDRVLSDLRWEEGSADAYEKSARAAYLEAEENVDPVVRHALLAAARSFATLAMGKDVTSARAHFAVAMVLVIEAQFSGWTPATREEAMRELLETRRLDAWDSDAAGEVGLMLLEEDPERAREWDQRVASQHGSKRIALFRLRLAQLAHDRMRIDAFQQQLRYACSADLVGPHMLARQARSRWASL